MEYIALGLTAIGLLLAHYYYRASRKPKQLNYYVRSSQPLLARGSTQHRHQVQVIVDGKQAQHPMSSVLRIENSGKVEITPDDYVEPLVVSLQNGRVLSLSTSTGPRNWPLNTNQLITEQSHGVSALRLPTMLLNEGEYLDLQVLTDQVEPVSVELKGRLVGTKIIEGAPTLGLKGQLSRTMSDRSFRVILVAGFILPLMVGTLIFSMVMNTKDAQRAASEAASEAEEKASQVRMPDVGGVPIDEAIELLGKDGIHVSSIDRRPQPGAPSGTTVSQEPGPNTTVDSGAGVNLVVAE